MNNGTKTFEITADAVTMAKIERFLALLHFNSRYGHSACFGMFLDGDGDGKVTVKPTPQFAKEVDLIGGVGGALEIANSDSYSCSEIKEMSSHWTVRQVPVEQTAPTLLKNDQIIKQICPE